jgi:uncharacterized membrane protein
MPKQQKRRATQAIRRSARPAARPAAAAVVPRRFPIVDGARGLAVATMIAYHFCFDLTWYGWAHWRMLDDPGWIAWRDAIVASFLFVSGVSLALRDPAARWFDRAFVRRWAEVAGAALLVTIGSVFVVHERYIYFGVLHFVAVAVWVCRRAPLSPALAAALGVVAIVAGTTIHHVAFDPRPLNWIGFAATKPLTDDYVPLFPWLGAVLLGCAAGGVWMRRGTLASPATTRLWNALPAPLATTLTAMGRFSLTIYLVHQPILFGAMAAIRAVA